ncbi:hypothetical protein POF50_006065 [Streptomyces sp. SL13]|jgi:hypothetical protein|uniref:Uncharacterized protein n=1 Tax=Streptantibioticus silvisoli TaxID=2705255 RepID=A0AA90H293_9ACTN|nr:hypothetical protein [Streptantibioticus silvisoli]MDI5965482.1 hypothetical protein [Streptantibioticus silvisoli]MDI5968912.1 hypothetical protein [Streptantibioticus silvisoli]
MKRVTRGVLAGAGVAVAVAVAVVSGPGAAFAATPATSVVPADTCTSTTSGNSVSGGCTISTALGTFGSTFSGTFGSNGMGSGTIVLQGGIIGNMNGTWSGGPFTGGPATINYTVQTPAGPVSGSFPVTVN